VRIPTSGGKAGRISTVKVLASLGLVGAAAAVAGLGTFGTFTDSTSVDTGTGSGVVAINLSAAAMYATAPAIAGGLLPGDTQATPFDVQNVGDTAWASVMLKSWATSSTLLDTDQVHGLQFTLQSCTQSWDVAGPGTYSCAGGVTSFYSGPIITEQALANAASLQPGKTDHLLATVSLPADAGNIFQGLSSGISFTFTAVQREGAAR
jgi:hypothetical protein